MALTKEGSLLTLFFNGSFLTGYLTKEGGSFISNWKRRFFVLDYVCGTLAYYNTDSTNERPLGVVVVRGSTVMIIAKKSKGKENCFSIMNYNRNFYAYADSKEEANEWIEALKMVFAIFFFL
jgi:hypothetical protein